MLFLHLLLAILAITPLTDARIRRWKCGSTSPIKGFLDGTHYIIAIEKSDAASRLHTREEEPYLPRISFPVVFHILDNPYDIILTVSSRPMVRCSFINLTDLGNDARRAVRYPQDHLRCI